MWRCGAVAWQRKAVAASGGDDRDAAFVYNVDRVAGVCGTGGAVNGVALSAEFKCPFGVACDRRGSVLISDSHNCVLRRLVRDANFDIRFLQVWLPCW